MAPAASAEGSRIEVIIPYKNTAALTAYYLGIFSIVCGIVLGLPALVLGILGLRYADRHPKPGERCTPGSASSSAAS